jgi:glycosyltransferase involved in cell wall biosynthesis
MTERRVQLHFGRFVHPIYREQLHAVPDGWSYAYDHPALTDETVATKRVVERAARFAAARAIGEEVALRALGAAGYVHRVKARPLPSVSLIHSCERLLRRPLLPYVLDLEHALLFVLYQRRALDRPWARGALERAFLDDKLRFLLPWSDAARRSVLSVLSPEVAAKVEPKLQVVSPSIRLATDRPKGRAGGPLRVLFVGTIFYEKGGVEAVRAIREVRKTHEVTLDMVSYAPPQWAAQIEAEPGVTLHEPGGADFIQRLYAEADVLLFPSHMDTFGYVVMEAMAHGLPVVAPRHLALTETIEDEVSGLLFPAENMLFGEDTRCVVPRTLPPPAYYLEALRAPSDAYVAGIAAQLGRLAEDPVLYATLAAGAHESVRSGPLSVARRKATLQSVYDRAVG